MAAPHRRAPPPPGPPVEDIASAHAAHPEGATAQTTAHTTTVSSANGSVFGSSVSTVTSSRGPGMLPPRAPAKPPSFRQAVGPPSSLPFSAAPPSGFSPHHLAAHEFASEHHHQFPAASPHQISSFAHQVSSSPHQLPSSAPKLPSPASKVPKIPSSAPKLPSSALHLSSSALASSSPHQLPSAEHLQSAQLLSSSTHQLQSSGHKLPAFSPHQLPSSAQQLAVLKDAASALPVGQPPASLVPKRRAPAPPGQMAPPPARAASTSPQPPPKAATAGPGGASEDPTENYQLAVNCWDALNLARTDPSAIVRELEAFRATFRDAKDATVRIDKWTQRRIKTNEGVAAVDEAIECLRNTSPLPAFEFSNELSRACIDHVLDHNQAGLMGHTGSDGSSTADRISRYGKWQRTCGENVDYGNADGMASVLAWIIDDGVSNRGHRTNIFNPAFTVVGIAYGPHSQFSVSCVLDFAGGFIPA